MVSVLSVYPTLPLDWGNEVTVRVRLWMHLFNIFFVDIFDCTVCSFDHSVFVFFSDCVFLRIS